MRKLLLTIAILAGACTAQAQDVSVRYQGQLIGSRGLPLANQNVAVCGPYTTVIPSTGTQPCSPLAPLGVSTSTSVGGTNPLTTDSLGNYFFYAVPGKYLVQEYGPQVSGQGVQQDIVIPTAVGANNNFTSINNVRWVDGVTLTTIQACVNALPSSGGKCELPPNYTETLAANLSITKPGVIIEANGPATVTQGTFQVVVSSTANSTSFTSPFGKSTNNAGSCIGACFINYSGAGGSAVVIGDGVQNVWGLGWQGWAIVSGSFQNNTVGMLLQNVVSSHITDYALVAGNSPSGVIGFKALQTGSGGFSGLSRIVGIECNYGTSTTNGICIQMGVQANAWTILSGHGNMGGSANGSVCIDVNGSTSSLGGQSNNFDCDVAAQALTIESTQVDAFNGFMRLDSGVTGNANWITFGAGSQGNVIEVNADPSGKVTDNGVGGTNSVKYAPFNTVQNQTWKVIQQSSLFAINSRVNGCSEILLDPQVSPNPRINSCGTNPFSISFDSGNGANLCDGSASLAHCYTLHNNTPVAARTINVNDPGATSGLFLGGTNLTVSPLAPIIAAAGCGGAAATISVNNGTAAFKINVGTTPGSACTFTMPAATTGWNCFATDITTNSTSVFVQKQTGAESTTSVTITNFSDVAAATAFVASDILKVSCHAD